MSMYFYLSVASMFRFPLLHLSLNISHMIKTIFLFMLFVIMNGHLLAQGTWTQIADLGYAAPNTDIFEPRMYAVCIGVGNKGYFGTGRISTSFTYKKDWWSYDSTQERGRKKRIYPRSG